MCGGHPDFPSTVRTRDGFPDFDGSHLLVLIDDVFEFRAEPPSRLGTVRFRPPSQRVRSRCLIRIANGKPEVGHTAGGLGRRRARVVTGRIIRNFSPQFFSTLPAYDTEAGNRQTLSASVAPRSLHQCRGWVCFSGGRVTTSVSRTRVGSVPRGDTEADAQATQKPSRTRGRCASVAHRAAGSGGRQCRDTA